MKTGTQKMTLSQWQELTGEIVTHHQTVKGWKFIPNSPDNLTAAKNFSDYQFSGFLSGEIWLSVRTEEDQSAVKRVELWTDHDIENPSNWDRSWKVYSFDRGMRGSVSPSEFFTENGKLGFEYQSKFRHGLLFPLSLYRHSGDLWSIQGEGMNCQWDTIDIAGIAVWENSPSDMDAKSPEDRRKDLRQFLQSYNSWVNGWGVGFSLIDEEGETVDSCGGFYGEEDVLSYLSECHPEYAGIDPIRKY